MRLWVPALGGDGSTGEMRHEEDLPFCCRGEAARGGAAEAGDAFECAACGAAWQLPASVEPEFDAFTYRAPDGREGAA